MRSGRVSPFVFAARLAAFLLVCWTAAPAPLEADPAPLHRLDAANPAAVYCRALGYPVEIVKTEDGERTVCVLPDGERVDAWAFYRGEVAEAYSWAERNGYRQEVRTIDHGAYTTREAVCIAPDGSVAGPVATLMGLDSDPGTTSAPTVDARALRPGAKSRDLPSSFSWLALGGCTSVKNQSSCGSCWAFASTAPLECNILIRDSMEVDLSEQWLVSCNQEDYGCNGGWWVVDYFLDKTDPCRGTGAVLEEYFPYTATDAPCNCPYPHDYFIRDWDFVEEGVSIPDVDLMKQAIYDYGPVCVAICVTSEFQAYNGGVFDEHANGTLNHGVALVGWDDAMGAEGVWILRNSWGPGWGVGGYMYIEYGCNRVGSEAVYVDYGCTETMHVAADGSGDYPTIADAIGAASPECLTVIDLEDGVYTGTGNRGLQIAGRQVRIRSATHDPAACILDGETLDRLAAVGAGGRLTLTGLTLRRGMSAFHGGALLCENADLSLTDCIVEACSSSAGGALYVEDGALSLLASTLTGNATAGPGGAVAAVGTSFVQITECELTENRAAGAGGAASIVSTEETYVTDCIVTGNRTTDPALSLIHI